MSDNNPIQVGQLYNCSRFPELVYLGCGNRIRGTNDQYDEKFLVVAGSRNPLLINRIGLKVEWQDIDDNWHVFEPTPSLLTSRI